MSTKSSRQGKDAEMEISALFHVERDQAESRPPHDEGHKETCHRIQIPSRLNIMYLLIPCGAKIGVRVRKIREL